MVKQVHCPRLSLWRLGLGDPLHSSVMFPRSDPCNFRVERLLRITKGQFHLGVSWFFKLIVFQGFRFTQSLGWKEWGARSWVQHQVQQLVAIFSEGFHDFFYLEAILELFNFKGVQFSSVQLSLSRAQLFVTSWTAAHQASLSTTNSQSLFKLMSIELVIPSNYLILCHPLLLLPSILPSIRVFSNESVLHIRWPKYWRSFSF